MRLDAGAMPLDTWLPRLRAQHDNTMLVLGGAGGGKTYLLLVVEGLFQHFLGPACIRKAAPTITASRLLGGNTLHALHRLLRGNLTELRGRMNAQSLARYRKDWAPVIGHAADEVGMLPPKLLHQINARTQTAKKSESTFGGLWTWLSGDFMQLPPIGQPSLALQPLSSDSVRVEPGVKGAEEAQTANPEHRAPPCKGWYV